MNPVTALDWHPITNKLLSVSTDRGVIVWQESEDVKGLKPQLAIIKETKSNIDGAWNHTGTKFVVGASSGKVFIGKYDSASDFWSAPTICKIFLFIILCSGQKSCSPQRLSGVSPFRPFEWESSGFSFHRWKMLYHILLRS